VLDSIDAASAVRLLGDPAKVRTYARILQEEAEIHSELGHDVTRIRERVADLTAQLPA
jgi:hypothetical protein